MSYIIRRPVDNYWEYHIHTDIKITRSTGDVRLLVLCARTQEPQIGIYTRRVDDPELVDRAPLINLSPEATLTLSKGLQVARQLALGELVVP